jgi:diguanylate cyclase (GGDEF)-like protein/PAS domain S-box-containing protein
MLEYTPYVLPFIFSTIILFLLGIYSFRLRDKVEIAGLFALQNLAMGIWTLSYALELSSTTLDGKIFWAKMKYIGATTGPVLWFVFSLYYTNHRNWLTTQLKIILGLFVVGTIGVVFTNEIHHWYWTKIFILLGYPESQSEHGFYFWVYAVSIYSLVLASVVIYINYYRTVPVYFRRQSIFLVVGTFLPLGIRVLEDFVGWDPFPKVDNVILFLLLSSVLYAVALFRFSALEIVPIAHSLVVQNINSGIIVLDVLGRVVELNPFVRKLLGSESNAFIGKQLSEILNSGLSIKYSPQMLERVEEEISFERDGRSSYFIVQVAPIRNDRKNAVGHVISLVNITERKYTEMELVRLARTDMLTGITNRRHFFELAENQFGVAQRYDHQLAILMLDVDHFKIINDQYGHLAGDFILQFVAQQCQSSMRNTDIFARYGGEEFICLLPEQTESGAIELAERIRQLLEQAEVMYEAQLLKVTASFGLALIQKESSLTLEQMIDRADQALYQSKRQGRNRITVWQAASSEKS